MSIYAHALLRRDCGGSYLSPVALHYRYQTWAANAAYVALRTFFQLLLRLEKDRTELRIVGAQIESKTERMYC